MVDRCGRWVRHQVVYDDTSPSAASTLYNACSAFNTIMNAAIDREKRRCGQDVSAELIGLRSGAEGATVSVSSEAKRRVQLVTEWQAEFGSCLSNAKQAMIHARLTTRSYMYKYLKGRMHKSYTLLVNDLLEMADELVAHVDPTLDLIGLGAKVLAALSMVTSMPLRFVTAQTCPPPLYRRPNAYCVIRLREELHLSVIGMATSDALTVSAEMAAYRKTATSSSCRKRVWQAAALPLLCW